MNRVEHIRQESHKIVEDWITSCTRRGKVSKNTVAVGIVVLDHLRRKCPLPREDVVSNGGEIKGSRGASLGKILEAYELPAAYLKEATTRQVHQDGQRLLESLEWGEKLATVTGDERNGILMELVEMLRAKAQEHLNREHLKLDIDRRESPVTWIGTVIEEAKSRSGGVVEQHLVGAKLERRFKGESISNHPAHAADAQTARDGDFAVSGGLVYHVTAAPGRDVIQKCAENLRAGRHPILLVPASQQHRAKVLAEDEGIGRGATIISIEDFVSMNIIELATEENKDFYSVLQDIVVIYNRRLKEVETDMSLQIEVK